MLPARRAALIVGDGNNRSALAAARALGSAGWVVGLGTPNRRSLAGSSRWVSRKHLVPLADVGSDAFRRAVNGALADATYDIVFAVGDAEALTLSMIRDELAVPVAFPPHQVMVRAFDKHSLSEAALSAGLAVPAIQLATDLALSANQAPYVVKAAQHWLGGGEGTQSRFDVCVTESAHEARAAASRLNELGARALLQEHVSGDLMAFATVLGRGGEVLARVQQHSSLIWPLGRGVSVRACTEPVDEGLATASVSMLRGLGWVGLAQLQFLRGSDGRPRLIDFNGRFYGSLVLSTAAGLNMPDVWGRAVLGEDVRPQGDAVPGVRYQWLEGDLRRIGDSNQSLTRGALGAFRYSVGSVHSIWNVRDPGPAIRRGASLARRGLTA